MAKKSVIINAEEFNPIDLNEVDANSSLFDECSSSCCNSHSSHESGEDSVSLEGSQNEPSEAKDKIERRKSHMEKNSISIFKKRDEKIGSSF